MTLPDGYRLRPLSADDKRAAIQLDLWAFPSGVDLETQEKLPLELPWDRFVGVVRDEPDESAVPLDGALPTTTELVAMHGSYPFEHFNVPGAETRVSGLTWVGVHPAHRRRGILSAMIDHHLAQCRERGEAISALFAAEAAIYGRFGYGLAAHDVRLTIPRGAKLRPVAGAGDHSARLEELTADHHLELVDSLHREAGRRPLGVGAPHGALLNRPGWATRDTPEMRRRHLEDLPPFRGGKETRRIVVVERDGEARGYATFRREVRWEDEGPRGTVHLSEIVALDAAAAHALWSVLLDLDLTSEVATFVVAPDDAILSLLVDPRGARTKRADNVWVRLVDVPAALAQRRYAADVDVVIRVEDVRLPENSGSYRVRAQAFAAPTVERTDDAPDLSLDVRELGAAYLGGATLASLALADLVTEHTAGSLAMASAAFAWPVEPVSSFIF